MSPDRWHDEGWVFAPGDPQTSSKEPDMCRKVTCDKCNKPTWAGCGEHIEEALKDVPPAERCTCPR